MKYYANMIIPIVLLIFVGTLYASESDMMITNVSGGEFTVSWITDQPCIGKVHLYKDLDRIGTYSDDRGESFQGITHYVSIRGTEANTAYDFELESGGIMDDHEGHFYPVATGPNLIPVGSIQPAGRVFLSDGHTPATGTIVYITLYRTKGTSSAPLSVLTDENGFWFIELVNAREDANCKELFNASENDDKLIISAKAGTNGSACLEAPVMDNQGGRKLYKPLILK